MELETPVAGLPSLSLEQQAVHDELINYALQRSSTPQMKMVKGWAGTGKSFTIGRVVMTLMSTPGYNDRIVFSAPTHKALKEIRRKGPPGVSFATIHSLLGIKAVKDDRTGLEKFEPSKDPTELRMDEFNLVILDEVSMVGKKLADLLIEYRKTRPDLKVIMMGDPCQIPPVGELDCVFFMHPDKYNIDTYELTTPRRQALEHPVLAHATQMRSTYKTQDLYPQTNVINGVGIEVYRTPQEKEIFSILEKHFCTFEFDADPDHMKVIAWRNEIVNDMNLVIRKMIYNAADYNMPKLYIGEKLILDRPYAAPNRVSLQNNDEIKVVSISEVTRQYQYHVLHKDNISLLDEIRMSEVDVKCLQVVVEYETPTFRKAYTEILVPHKDAELQWKEMLNSVKTVAESLPWQQRAPIWKHMYKMRDSMAEIKYNYAITGHKCQGSTYENAMVIEWDLDKNRRFLGGRDIKVEERNRIKYVAFTRVRKMLYIIR